MSAKVHTTNYQNTLITPAEDTKAVHAVMPPLTFVTFLKPNCFSASAAFWLRLPDLQ